MFTRLVSSSVIVTLRRPKEKSYRPRRPGVTRPADIPNRSSQKWLLRAPDTLSPRLPRTLPHRHRAFHTGSRNSPSTQHVPNSTVAYCLPPTLGHSIGLRNIGLDIVLGVGYTD
ncbi:hypothetical protein J6590_036143 [Homalodisca vitripennis]|nr:hypothetical protein J6590_036143 [Homalodisca vitripennis]